jgi:high-affinity nickel-transport protein
MTNIAIFIRYSSAPPTMLLLPTLFDDRAHAAARKLGALFAIIVAANLGAWAWALVALHGHPTLLATALLAYTLGLRHAVDADHIAAIDNVIRKLMQEGKRPLSAGFFFALGHSTVVVAMTVAVCVAATALAPRLAAIKSVGGVVGTLVSATYLCLLGMLNLVILGGAWRAWRQRAGVGVRARVGGADMRSGGMDTHLGAGGVAQHGEPAPTRAAPLARLMRPLFRIATRSWHMYPIGLLFGLGFDTASEVALFALAAAEASRGLSLWSVLLFPALFTAAMALGDTADGALMIRAYGWATTKPARKLFYNLAITLVSVLVAFGIAGVELLGLLRSELDLAGPFWTFVERVNGQSSAIGYAIVAVFLASWLLSVMRYKSRRRLRVS